MASVALVMIDRRHFFQEVLVQQRGRRRSGPRPDHRRPGGLTAWLRPNRRCRGVLCEPLGQAQALEAIGGGGEILPLFGVVEFLAVCRDHARKLPGPRPRDCRDLAAGGPGRCPPGCPREPLVDVVEELPGPRAGIPTPAAVRHCDVVDQQAAVGAVVVQLLSMYSTWPLEIRKPRCSPATDSTMWASSKITTS